MARIDQETVNRILETADIVEVVSDFVKLRRSGANYKGLCPFHNEKTPSFSVNKARNICKCFSCGKGGSPVNFIMEHEQMSYQEALRYLARKYNIEIVEKEMTSEERRAQSERESLFAVNQFAMLHFEHNLTETDDGQDIAMAYLRHRGVSDAMIKRFHLGYAIDRGDNLLKAAMEAGFAEDKLVATGLEVETERDGEKNLYDRFRGRVIFPIHSVAGRVVGFGGRTMRTDKNIAKYVNSPESLIYRKNLELYGFYQAKPAIARKDKAILVEGYLDVISMHQAGVENVVASSGTSLTEGQIRAIRRFTRNVTIIYDADAAGIKASLRAINMLLAEEMDVKVLLLPEGDDPDSFAQNHSSSEVEEYMASHETDIIAFMADILLRQVGSDDPTGRAKVLNTILRSVAWVTEPVKRQEYISLCSRLFSVPEKVINSQLTIFTAERYEELRKQQQREIQEVQHREDKPSVTAENKAQDETATAPQKQQEEAPEKLVDLSPNKLKPYEAILLRYAVRYGFKTVGQIVNEHGLTVPATVIDIINAELDVDGITFTYEPFKRLYDAIMDFQPRYQADLKTFTDTVDAECAEKLAAGRAATASRGGGIDALQQADAALVAEIEEYRRNKISAYSSNYVQNRLLNSPDDFIRKAATFFVSEKYTLSKIYTRTGNVESEEDLLAYLVPRAVNELRNAILNEILIDLNARLSELDPADEGGSAELMQQIVQYKELQRTLLKELGDRIILPR